MSYICNALPPVPQSGEQNDEKQSCHDGDKREKTACRNTVVQEIREEGYLYVDKTEMVWNLANNGARYDYLSRPRRFGKSVLVDTLQCYFEGRKELFEGLKIMEIEKNWTCHPVIRLDMSNGSDNAKDLEAYLDFVFSKYEKLYETKLPDTASLTVRFSNIIETANKMTGKQVVILIDEYDSPLQHSWKTPEHENCTRVYRSVFSVLKTLDEIERFVFITGITKFTQISLFSVLNNLSNISFDAEYAGICGITQQELADNSCLKSTRWLKPTDGLRRKPCGS